MAASATICAMILLPSSSPPPSERSTSNSALSPSSRKLLLSGLLFVSSPNSRRITTVAAERPDKGSCNGSLTQHTSFSQRFSCFTESVLNFANSNFLPLALISAVTIGMVNPALGCQAHKYSLSKFATFGIFFIAGLKLKGEEVEAVAETWPLGLFGLASILLVGPFMAMLILRVQFAPQEFVTGLALFCCVPTTLSSGVALTQLVGGNSALALTMTVISNLLGILTVPFWVSKLLADGFGVSIPVRQLLWNLTLMLLVPLLLGKVVRNSFQGLGTYVDKNRRIFTITSIILLSLTPWMQVSKARPLLVAVKLQVFIKAIAMGILVHLAMLGVNIIAIRALSAGSGGKNSGFSKKENARALLMVCSQKALLIVVTVVEQLGGALGQSGLLVIPCIAAHINQVSPMSLYCGFLHRHRFSSPVSPSSHNLGYVLTSLRLSLTQFW